MDGKKLLRTCLIGLGSFATGYLLLFCDPPVMFSISVILLGGLIIVMLILQLANFISFAIWRKKGQNFLIPIVIAALLYTGSELAFKHFSIQQERNSHHAKKLVEHLESELKMSGRAPKDPKLFFKTKGISYTGLHYGIHDVVIDYHIHSNNSGFTLTYYNAMSLEVNSYNSDSKEWNTYTDAGAISFGEPVYNEHQIIYSSTENALARQTN